jgi:hypothetical protein
MARGSLIRDPRIDQQDRYAALWSQLVSRLQFEIRFFEETSGAIEEAIAKHAVDHPMVV